MPVGQTPRLKKSPKNSPNQQKKPTASPANLSTVSQKPDEQAANSKKPVKSQILKLKKANESSGDAQKTNPKSKNEILNDALGQIDSFFDLLISDLAPIEAPNLRAKLELCRTKIETALNKSANSKNGKKFFAAQILVGVVLIRCFLHFSLR